MTVYTLNSQTAWKWKELSAAQEKDVIFRVTLTNGKMKKSLFSKYKIIQLGSSNRLHWKTMK